MNEVPPDDVEALIELFEASHWTELHLALDGFELTLSNDPALESGVVRTPPQAPASVPAGPIPAASSPASAAVDPNLDPGALAVIRAPNLGHFYRAPKPGTPPFVEVGSHVEPDDTVCVIEVMKLFTLLSAGVAGTVRRICVQDAEMVEFDQPLFYVEPDS